MTLSLLQDTFKAWNQFTERQFRLNISRELPTEMQLAMEEALAPDRIAMLPWPVQHKPWVDIEQRLTWAVRRDDLEAITQLLVTLDNIEDEVSTLLSRLYTGEVLTRESPMNDIHNLILTNLLTAAVDEGRLAIVQLLLPKVRFRASSQTSNQQYPDYHELYDILMIVGKKGQVDVLQLLLADEGTAERISPKYRRALAMKATGKGNVRIIELLLNGHQLDRGPLMRTAVDKNHPAIVQLLLPTMEPRDKWEFQIAARDGDLETVRRLLPTINSAESASAPYANPLTLALELAAEHGQEEVVRLLLPKQMESADLALYGAIRGGHSRIAQLLIANSGAGELDEQMSLAVEYGRTEIVDQLLNDPRVGDFDYVLSEGVQGGHVETINMVLATNRVTDLDDAIANAVGDYVPDTSRQAHIDVVRLLLPSNKHKLPFRLTATVTNLDEALTRAARDGHLEIVQMLVEEANGTLVGEHSYRYSIVKASGNGHLAVIEYLLSKLSAQPLLLAIEEALKPAAKHNQGRVLDYLLDTAPPEFDPEEALINVWNVGNMHLIERLSSMITPAQTVRVVASLVPMSALGIGWLELYDGYPLGPHNLEAFRLLLASIGDAVTSIEFEAAVWDGDVETVQRALATGSYELEGVLEHANNVDVARVLLEHIENDEDEDLDYSLEKVLDKAASYGNSVIIQLLFRRWLEHLPSSLNKYFIKAAGHGSWETIKLFLELPHLRFQLSVGGALSMAAEYGRDEVVRGILEHGVGRFDIDDLNRALELASRNGRTEIARMLLDHQPSKLNIEDALASAVRRNKTEVAQLLSERLSSSIQGDSRPAS